MKLLGFLAYVIWCVCVCVCVPVLAEAERVGQKCDRSAANRSGIVFLLDYKSTHTCEP